MKRIIIAVIIMAAVLGFSTFEFIYVGAKADRYIDRIDSIEKLAAQDNTAAVCGVRALEQDWENDSQKMYTLLIHDYVDNVGGSISRLRAYIEHGDTNMLFAESTGAKKGLASIKGSEYPYFENIL